MNGLDGPPRVIISKVSIIMLSRLRLRDKRHHSNLPGDYSSSSQSVPRSDSKQTSLYFSLSVSALTKFDVERKQTNI